MKEDKSYGVDVYSFNVNTGLTITGNPRPRITWLRVGGFSPSEGDLHSTNIKMEYVNIETYI